MIDKEVKIEWIKFFIRGAEIILLGMIVAPLATFFLKRDVMPGGLLVVLLAGSAGILTFLLIANILWRRWRQ